MLLDVEELTVCYGRRIAVDALSLRVDAGEVVGLLGPNGAGKSTLLLTIAGALEPKSGRIIIDGVDSRGDPLTTKAKVGLADQPPTMYEFLTAEEHVSFVAEARGQRDGHPTKELLSRLDLGSVAGRLVRELSFGYRQRVGLAAALAGKTRVVLLDETLNGLDPHAARAAREVVLATARLGACVLMSTHLLGVAERLCTRLVLMNQGRIVRDITGTELGALVSRGPGAIEELYVTLLPRESSP